MMAVDKSASMDTESVRRFYRRLNHHNYGVTELAVIDPRGEKGIIATGFFDDEDSFIKACKIYNGKYNIYAGRNPRPRWFPKVCENYLDTRYRQRARDSDIQYMTAISLDIDPVRPKETSATERQRGNAIDFALRLQSQIGGWVDDSGNGAYLWISFKTPIRVDNDNRYEIKEKCRTWQSNIVKAHQPGRYGLRIDGCFDLSRLKKVIGTMSVKGKVHRLSRFVKEANSVDDEVKDAILSLSNCTGQKSLSIKPDKNIPAIFLRLLRIDPIIRNLWLTPDENNDTSMHDWMLGCELVKAGIRPEDMAKILMINPFGKYRRDQRYGYVQTTVSKLLSEKWQ